MEACKYIAVLTVDDLFALSHVHRYHTEHTTRVQSVAEHSYRVSMMAVKELYELFRSYPGWAQKQRPLAELELEIYRYGLTHDIDEIDGDIPTNVKQRLRESGINVNSITHRHYWGAKGIHEDNREVDPLVKGLVSFLDSVEGCLFATHRIPDGNAKFGVLADWDVVLQDKIRVYEPLFPEGFLVSIYTKLYRYADSTWV